MKIVCFVQTHFTNIRDNDLSPDNYCISSLKKSTMIDEIILASANLPENEILFKVAEDWGVQCYLGSIDNIVKRMNEVACEYNADIIVRVLIDWFYIDINLIDKMIMKLINEKLDYVKLPYDFDIKFGADVHSVKIIKEIDKILDKDDLLKEQYKFRPWFLMDENADKKWNVSNYNETPVYQKEEFYKLKEDIKNKCPLAWDFGPTFHNHTYAYAANHINSNDIILDIACGWGNGSKMMAKKAKQVIGVDIVSKYIETAIKRNDRENCNFLIGDGTKLKFSDDYFDKVISVHTMEHIYEQELFLKEVSRVLKPNGLFIIEVPVKMKKPFLYNPEPFMGDHVREYLPDRIKKCM